jgi:DUF1365 family protein
MGVATKPMQRMRSCLYECTVMHHRFSPKNHRFSYRIFMLSVDLDELEALGRAIPIFSVNRANLYSLSEKDYLPTSEALHNAGPPGPGTAAPGGLKARVLGYLGEHGVRIPGGRVTLITLPRVAGFLFNPVSFYFCYDADGRPAAAIAEVTNTFHEVKPYFLGPESLGGHSADETFKVRVPKFFYVSPFSDVDVAFEFRLRVPNGGMAICIDDYSGENRTLATALTGVRRSLSGWRLAWYALKYPMITLRVVFLIHLNALRLRMKQVPWFAKAARAADQRELYRPHESIAGTPHT